MIHLACTGKDSIATGQPTLKQINTLIFSEASLQAPRHGQIFKQLISNFNSAGSFR